MNKLPALLLFLLIAACEVDKATEPTEPSVCDKRYACLTQGIDLAVLNVRQVEAGSQSVGIEFVVVNIGTESSGDSRNAVLAIAGMETEVNLPRLAPGDSAVISDASVFMTRSFLYHAKDSPILAEVKVVSPDANMYNNVMTKSDLSLPIPLVTLEIRLDSAQSVRIGQSFALASSIRTNPSNLRNAVSRLYCLRRGTLTCAPGGWDALRRDDQNSTGFTNSTYFVQSTTVGTPAPGVYDILVCVVPRTHIGLRIDPANPEHICEVGGTVNILP